MCKYTILHIIPPAIKRLRILSAISFRLYCLQSSRHTLMRLDLLDGMPVFAVAMAKLSCFLSSLFILLPISCTQFPTKCKRVIQQRKALHLLAAKLRSPSPGCRSSVELPCRRAGGEPKGRYRHQLLWYVSRRKGPNHAIQNSAQPAARPGPYPGSQAPSGWDRITST